MGQPQSAEPQGQLEDHYFVQKIKLGQGSFGTVWRAVERQGGSTVAVKQLEKASLPKRGVVRKDIEREIDMMKAVPHQNITQLVATFEDETCIYLVLEYCDGGDFGDKVKEKGVLASELDVCDWMRQILAAVRALHSKGICHRDIKPDNFMVQGVTLKLSDFGLALYMPEGRLLQEKCGTPAFMAPEQHHLPKRSPGYGCPVDMWAAGVSMYMVMFGGKHPFLTEKGGLDDQKLLNGELDFRDTSISGNFGFFGFGAAPLRLSEMARAFCLRMVETDVTKRVTCGTAVNSRWFQTTFQEAAPPAAAAVDELKKTPQKRSAATSRREKTVAVEVAAVKTLGPEDSHKALEQAARLKDENRALMTELEQRKRREEELVHQQKLLELQQRMLELRKVHEAEELEKRKTQVQRERDELQRERMIQTTVVRKTPQVATLEKEALAQLGRPLRPGSRCRYESQSYGWMPAVVICCNESDGTYDLDVRKHAAPENIAPPDGAAVAEAWPPGALVQYLSNSASQWLPAVVNSFNESEGTYNLDLRKHAEVDRIRARLERRKTKSLKR